MTRDICFYDGQCGMCRRSTSTLRGLDWLHRLEFVDQTSLPPDQLPVPPVEALRGMPMRTSDGRVLVGFPAVRRALRRTPLGFFPALALYPPGISWMAAVTYRRVAEHRARDATCQTRSIA